MHLLTYDKWKEDVIMEKFIIDVSHHQGVIDWEAVKAAGVEGAIIRCGYGMDQMDQDDKQWKRNADECVRLEIPFGSYLYSYADSTEKAESEARHAIRLLAGYKLSYPVYYDLEESGTESGAAKRAKIFCEAVKSAGYMPGVYANKHWWDNYLAELTGYTRWVARYGNTLGISADMWQYASDGAVAGIQGNVDLNRCYRDFPSEIASGSSAVSTFPPVSAKEQLTVDGKWGSATTKRLQQIFGTTVDGRVSHQFASYRELNPGLDYGSFQWEENPSGYSPLIKAFQGCLNIWIHAGLTEDGHIGPKTIKGIQSWLGCGADGYFDAVSPSIRKMQEWINRQ